VSGLVTMSYSKYPMKNTVFYKELINVSFYMLYWHLGANTSNCKLSKNWRQITWIIGLKIQVFMNPHKLCVVVLYEDCSNETHMWHCYRIQPITWLWLAVKHKLCNGMGLLEQLRRVQYGSRCRIHPNRAVFFNISGVLMLAFKGTNITINTQPYYETLQDLCIVIMIT
jgi:hypothetical protein